MDSVQTELLLVALSAMLSPTTLSFSVLALVLSKQPRRTGIWFWLGAVVATLAIGVIAAFVLGDHAAPSSGDDGRKTWVSVFDLLAGVALLVYVLRTWRKPMNEKMTTSMVDKMSNVVTSRWIAIFAAGATLANPGGFIPVALKTISEMGPSAAEYVALWVGFTFISVLPLFIAVVLLTVAPERTRGVLGHVREWLLGHIRLLASAIFLLLAIALLRNGIAGLT